MAEEKREKPKFNVGDNVWFIEGRKVIEKVIQAVFYYDNNLKYGFSVSSYSGGEYDDGGIGVAHGSYIEPKFVFATKKQLTDSL